jgi:hypothetical protein
MSAHSMPSARVLRLLATNYIFKEVSPDVFTNNRLSTVLDTRKPLEELISKWVLHCVRSPDNALTSVMSSAPNRSTLGPLA